MKKICILSVLLFMIALTSRSWSADIKPLKPGPNDKCPVCGMFVAKYSNFACQIQFNDGTVAFFDGPKDMFTYYHNLGRYNPRKKQTDIAAIFVTSYYNLSMVDGLKAFYVIGSNVYGPMGRELIPFAKESEARGFIKDHKGKLILHFHDVTPKVLKTLD